MTLRALLLPGAAPPGARSNIPLFAKGFRPFFLAAALFATLMVPLWVLVLFGTISVKSHLDPVTWHAHEMVFGFTAAVLAGFLLTAVGNWTSRETATGRSLAALTALWIAGRLAMTMGAGLPSALVAGIDLAFLPAVALAIGRPIFAAKNRRNYVVLAMVLALFAANAAVHFGPPRAALLVGVDLVTFFMVVITGRVVPMFTRNATRSTRVRSHPKLDMAAALSLVVVAAVDGARAGGIVAFAAYALAAALVAARAVHWDALASRRDPLLLVMHAGHAWIPIGLALRAASAVAPTLPASAGLHALTVGAIGALTLGMMARVSLGHTGRPLAAPAPIAGAFALVTTAAVVRVFVPLVAPGLYVRALSATAVLWALAFALYVAGYARILGAPRADGKPG